uniref:hypothetical protein RF1 n=1 Tax=Prosopanche bonacinae TaxID=2952648 RepID=UPI0021156B02|nr:hypothetical protein RF1 [Prosopanche bonacinae]USN93694.1 hypothetical protein RF1 [Prosopanche bonacinae]
MGLSIYYTPLFIFFQKPHALLCILLYYAFYKGIIKQLIYWIDFEIKLVFRNVCNLELILFTTKKQNLKKTKSTIKMRPVKPPILYKTKKHYLEDKYTLKMRLLRFLYKSKAYYHEIKLNLQKKIEKFILYLIKNYKEVSFKFNYVCDIIIKLFIFQIINFNLPSPIFKRLSISFLFKNSANKIVFLVCNILGSICSYFIVINYIYKMIIWFKFKFYLKKNESIKDKILNKVINSFKNKDSLDIYFLYIYLSLFLVFLARTPVPLFTFSFQRTGLKAITFNDRRIIVNRSKFPNAEKEKKHIDINDVELENKIEKKKKLQGGESEIEESDVEEEEENLLNIAEEDNKDLVDIFYYPNRWNRPLRYIKNKKFDKVVRNEMSQLFFNVSKIDNNKRLGYTFSPNLYAFFKLIKKNTSYLKKIDPYDMFHLKKKITNFENEFKKRIEFLDKSKPLNLFERTNRFFIDFDKERTALLKLDDVLKGNFYESKETNKENENITKKETNKKKNKKARKKKLSKKARKKKLYESLPPIFKFLENKKEYEETQEFIIEEKKLPRWVCSLKDDIEFILLKSRRITGLKCAVLRPLVLYKEPPKDEKKETDKITDENEKTETDKITDENEKTETDKITTNPIKIEYKLPISKFKLACISRSLSFNVTKRTEDKKVERTVDKDNFFGYDFEKRIEEDEKKKGELHDIRLAEVYDLNYFFVRGSLRNQRRKEVIDANWGDEPPASPIFSIDLNEKDRLSGLNDNDLLENYGPDNIDRVKDLYKKEYKRFLEAVEAKKRAAKNATWDTTYGIVNMFRTSCLLYQLYLRKIIKIPFLIMVKTIVRILLLQPFEYTKDRDYFMQEKYIMCTYHGIELVENKLPEDWMSEGIQIKIINPFRLRPWYTESIENEEKEKIKMRDSYTFLNMQGQETRIISSDKVERLLQDNFFKLVYIGIANKINEIQYKIIGLIFLVYYNIQKIRYTISSSCIFFYNYLRTLSVLIFRLLIFVFFKQILIKMIVKIFYVIRILSKTKLIEDIIKSKWIEIILYIFQKSYNYNIGNKSEDDKIKEPKLIKWEDFEFDINKLNKSIILLDYGSKNYDLQITYVIKIQQLSKNINRIELDISHVEKKIKKKETKINILKNLKINSINILKDLKVKIKYIHSIYHKFIYLRLKSFIYYVQIQTIHFIIEKSEDMFNWFKVTFQNKYQFHKTIKEEYDIASNYLDLSIKKYAKNLKISQISQAYLLYSLLFKHDNYINLNKLRILLSNIGFSWESFIISSNKSIPKNFVNQKNIKKNYQFINLLKKYSLNEEILPLKFIITNKNHTNIKECLSIQNILFKNEKQKFDSDKLINQNKETENLIKIIIKKRKQQEKERKSKEEKERKEQEKKEKEEEERRKKGKIKSEEEKRKEEEEDKKKKEEEERKKKELQTKKRQEKLIINKGKKYFRRHLVKKNLHKFEEKLIPEFKLNKTKLYNLVITAPNNLLLSLKLRQIKYIQNPWLFPINQFFNTKIEEIHEQLYLKKVSEKDSKVSEKNVKKKDTNKVDSQKGEFSKALNLINKKHNTYSINFTRKAESFIIELMTRIPLMLRNLDQINFTDNADLKKQKKDILYTLLFQITKIHKMPQNSFFFPLFFGNTYDLKNLIKNEEVLDADRQRFTWLYIDIIPNSFINPKFILHHVISLSLNHKTHKKKNSIMSPEIILTSKLRRQLRIFTHFKTNDKNQTNLTKIDSNCFKHKAFLKKIYNNNTFIIKVLWPNYSFEDLACINRYCLNTSNGSHFSMFRFNFYPKL